MPVCRQQTLLRHNTQSLPARMHLQPLPHRPIQRLPHIPPQQPHRHQGGYYMSEYAEQCPDFVFFWPNGVPDYAKKWCLECIHLANTCPSKEEHEKQNYRCEIPSREAKRKTFYECKDKRQTLLEVQVK